MKSWLTLIFQTLKVFILFTGCTILFYFGITWLNEEYQDYHHFDEPKGTAVKVSTGEHGGQTSWLDRLILFYLNGE
ncbi:YqzK family protein [Cytobacillus sp. Hz8]|uniref:YqzK family protein n=1 Tax=Cytobacillus sp. Hz8 TaxID=3347168 RepID=UPI0035DF78D1